MTILGSLVDRYRTLRNGKKRWVGQVLRFAPDEDRKCVRSVIAEVYGPTVEEMRERKAVVCGVLRDLERSKRPRLDGFHAD